ncbi:MAG TPA: S9 family peptidase [Thermoanaerobaculia bacterium]|nr:S9 family peptidase [Thermoanaerobaculia bacterium]
MPTLAVRCARVFPVLLLGIFSAAPVSGQLPPDLDAELHRIFEKEDYKAKSFGPVRWLENGRSYAVREDSTGSKDLFDIAAYDTASGRRQVLVAAPQLSPAAGTGPLKVDDFAVWSDGARLLIFTDSKKVWRQNTRGDYWVWDRGKKTLRELGGAATPSTLMFAKFSPDGSRVAYVRENDLYVEDLATGEIRALTRDGSATLINGTSDWVDEEELEIRDGFRWSPDGRHIAFWQFDTTGVEIYTLANDTDALYPTLTRFPYPKAGTRNSAARIGVVDVGTAATVWMQPPGNPRETYIPRMEWVDNGTLALEQLNRRQNQNDLVLANARTGDARAVFRDQSKTWVEYVDQVRWIDGNRDFLWESEKDGWRHVYRVARAGSPERLLTPFEGDVIKFVGVDERAGWLYFTASPGRATDQYLYRSKLDGSGAVERITPAAQPGTHAYQLSADGKWAIHTYSRFDQPPSVELVSLPDYRAVRTLVDNTALKTKADALLSAPSEFFQIDIGGATLDGWMIKPPHLDPARKYPMLVYVYGEPAGQTVTDAWGGDRELFHRALALQGYLVVSFDNRGTPAPRGVAWRKSAYGAVGDLSSKDQAAAVKALAAQRPYVDASRVGIWGWSGGGSSTLNAMFRFPDIYKVGIAVAPVPDQRLYDSIYQERYMGLPDDNADGYRLGSPITFAEGLKGKLLIVHGSGDDNVHYQGTERLVNRLIELGKPFDLMVYPNRTHAIKEGKGTSLHLHSLIARYFLTNLPPGPAAK